MTVCVKVASYCVCVQIQGVYCDVTKLFRKDYHNFLVIFYCAFAVSVTKYEFVCSLH